MTVCFAIVLLLVVLIFIAWSFGGERETTAKEWKKKLDDAEWNHNRKIDEIKKEKTILSPLPRRDVSIYRNDHEALVQLLAARDREIEEKDKEIAEKDKEVKEAREKIRILEKPQTRLPRFQGVTFSSPPLPTMTMKERYEAGDPSVQQCPYTDDYYAATAHDDNSW